MASERVCTYLATTLAVVGVMQARLAQAQASCPIGGGAVNVNYTAAALPEDDPVAPWMASGSGVATVSGGVLSVAGLRTYQRTEDVGGLTPGFDLAARVRLGPGTIALGGLVQDRVAEFFLVVAPDGTAGVTLGKSSGTVVGQTDLDLTAWHVVAIDATRGGAAHLFVDGQLVALVEWHDLPAVPEREGGGFDPAAQAIAMFGSLGAQSDWDWLHYSICVVPNLRLSIRTELPPPGALHVLPGGTGQTLSGLRSLSGVVTAVELRYQGGPTIQALPSPMPVVLAGPLDDTSSLAGCSR